MAMALEPVALRGTEQVFEFPYYIKALALAIPAILLGLELSAWLWMNVVPPQTDFRHLYAASYMARTHHFDELYSYSAQKQFQDLVVSPDQFAAPFNHLAYEALLFVPLSLLRYRTAFGVFAGVNLVLLAVCFSLLRPNLKNIVRLCPLLFLSFIPIAETLQEGQDSIILLALAVGAFLALEKGKDEMAGGLVGLGMFKFSLIVPIAIPFLLWRRWRFSAGFLLSSTVLTAGSFWLVGLRQVREYLRTLSAMSSPGIVDQFKYQIFPLQMASLRGPAFAILQSHPSAVRVVALILSSALLLCVGFLTAPKAGDALLVAIVAGSLASYHFYIHDLSLVLIPIVVILGRFAAKRDKRALVLCAAAVVMFLAPAPFLFIQLKFIYLLSIPLLGFLVLLAKEGLNETLGSCRHTPTR